MLTLAGVAKSYGARDLFNDVTFTLDRSDRVGLVGPNGAGKTTLFRLIRGEEVADDGEITRERGARLGFLPQESAPVGPETILALALGVAVVTSHEEAAASEHIDDEQLVNDHLREVKARRILGGLGFRPADFDRPARSFSGGWVMRAHLARLLVEEPDILLLDEPTNHLDLETLLWFQGYLMGYPGGILVVSHDRSFLNALVTSIFELRRGRLHRYRGNYDSFLDERAAREEQQLSAFKNQQREIDRLQRFISRFGAKATKAAQARSKRKQIERMILVDAPEDEDSTLDFDFPQPPRSPQTVLTLKDVHFAYGDLVVYDQLDYEVERGQRTVLVGPNGAGKSTFLKLLAGVLTPGRGTRNPGNGVTVGYFSQNRLEQLDPERTVLEEALAIPGKPSWLGERHARGLLGAFLFRKEDVFKPVKVLSGGEKSRLSLAKLLLAPPNFMLLDEPTTHLDIPSINALTSALEDYEGTLIFISHDITFIRAVASQVIHVEAGKLTPYAGDYDYFLEKSAQRDARRALTAGSGSATTTKGPDPDKPRSGPKTREQRRLEAEARQAVAGQRKALRTRVEKLENDIQELEREQSRLADVLEDPATYDRAGAAHAANRDLQAVVHQLEAATAAWEKAAAQLEALEGKLTAE